MTGPSKEQRLQRPPPRVIGRYEIHDRIASGGMASVYFGRLVGPVGFSRTVAIKRLHSQYAQDPEFVSMFLDEARLAGRIRHPNVVPTLDVVAMPDELFLVMDYVQGEALGRLVKAARARDWIVPVPVVTTIFLNVLEGLHAAHEVTDDDGHLLDIVHRDVSPQNILVGVDGVARVLDFGVAKAGGRVHQTKSGVTKGKTAYMAPEQILGEADITRAADIYAASVCLWEALTGERLYDADSEPALLYKVLRGKPRSPRRMAPHVPEVVSRIVLRGLTRDSAGRFATAHEMARALASAGPVAAAMEVAEWVRSLAGQVLSERAAIVAGIERSTSSGRSAEAEAFVQSLKAEPLLTLDPDDVLPEEESEPDPEGTSPTHSRAAPIGRRSDRKGRTGVIVGVGAGLVLAAAAGGVLMARSRGSESAPAISGDVPSPAVVEGAAGSSPAIAPPDPVPVVPASAPMASSVPTVKAAPVTPPRAPPRPAYRPPTPRPEKASDGLFERN